METLIPESSGKVKPTDPLRLSKEETHQSSIKVSNDTRQCLFLTFLRIRQSLTLRLDVKIRS
jgi:hypothetical protein